MFLATNVLALLPLVVYISADQHINRNIPRTWALNVVNLELIFNSMLWFAGLLFMHQLHGKSSVGDPSPPVLNLG